MEAMNPVNWFEIPVDDLDRAKKFYETVLGIELTLNEMGPLRMAWFPMTEGLPGATGSLVKGEGYTPSTAGSLVYFTVKDLDETLGRVSAAGGRVLFPKMSIGDYGFIDHFQDSEGNRVALHADENS
jgi:predicted enzyme related to lactoylglutathione lyase